jgi:hypothetical protein
MPIELRGESDDADYGARDLSDGYDAKKNCTIDTTLSVSGPQLFILLDP